MDGTILPELAALAGPATIVSRTLRSASLGESRVAERLRDLFEASSNPSVAYLASSSEVKVRLTAKAPTEQEAQALLAPLVAEVRARLGDALFTVDDEELEEAVGRLLRAAGKTVACAESLTGGGVATRLTSVPGASDYLIGSAVDLHGRREARGPGRLAGDDRRSGCGQRGLRARDGRGRPPGVRRRHRPVVDGRGGPGAARRRRTGNRLDRRSTRTTCTTRAGSTCRASASASAGGPSRRRSICCGGTWRASRSPAATSERHPRGRRSGRSNRRAGDAVVPRRGRAGGRRPRGDCGDRAVASGVPERPLGAARELAHHAEVPRSDRGRSGPVGGGDRRRHRRRPTAAPRWACAVSERSRRWSGHACSGPGWTTPRPVSTRW